MANIITGTRILCSMMLLLFPALSIPFYLFYIVAGITDMIDGTIARKTNTASEFGAKFDTVADFVFIAVCLFKLIPALDIDGWIYLWIIFIVIIKAVNIVSGYEIQRKFVVVHSMMNKVTGALLFVLPFTLPLIELKYTALVICLIATFAAIQEGHYIRTNKNTSKNLEVLKIKSILEQVRKPQNDIPLNKQIAETVGIILFGFALGVLQKWMDGTAVNAFPVIIQQLDIGNYFGRLAIWILLATTISVYAKSPLRAAINTFFFFISMLAGYIISTVIIC